MKTSLTLWLIAALLLALAGCAKQCGKPTAPASLPAPKVPNELNLFPMRPVLAAQFNVDRKDIQLLAARALAAPTRSTSLDRDVLVVARNADHFPLAMVSVDDPLAVRTAGEEGHEHRRLERATFLVFLPEVELIRSLEVRVVHGPMAGWSNTFAINPDTLPAFTTNWLDTRRNAFLEGKPSP